MRKFLIGLISWLLLASVIASLELAISYKPDKVCKSFVCDDSKCVCETSAEKIDYPIGAHTTTQIGQQLTKVSFEQKSIVGTFAHWISIITIGWLLLFAIFVGLSVIAVIVDSIS